MGSTHARYGVWLLGCALALGIACRSREAGPAPGAETAVEAATSAATAFADIAADLAPLRARFQEDDGLVRVIMLVAPT